MQDEPTIRDEAPEAAADPVGAPSEDLFDVGNHPMPEEFPDDGDGAELLDAGADPGVEAASTGGFGDGGVRALTADQLADISDNLQLLAFGREDGIGMEQMEELQELLDRCEVDIAHPVHREIDLIEGEEGCTHARLCQAFLRAGVWLNVHVRMPGEEAPPPEIMNEDERRNFSLVYNEDRSALAARMANGKALMLKGAVEALQADDLVGADAESVPCREDAPSPAVASMAATEDAPPSQSLMRASEVAGGLSEADGASGGAAAKKDVVERAPSRGNGGLAGGLGALAATAIGSVDQAARSAAGGLGKAARSAVTMVQRRRAEGACEALSTATGEMETCAEELAKGGAVGELLPRAQHAMLALRAQGRVLETLKERHGVSPAGGSAAVERGATAAKRLASELDTVGGDAARSEKEREDARELAELCREMTRALMELVRKLLGRAPAEKRSAQPAPGR